MSGLQSTTIAATTAAVTNRIVTSANMKVGTYTVANASAVWASGFKVTVTHTEVGGEVDTLGTIAIVGKDLFGVTVSETLTPVDGQTVTGVQVFRSVTSVTGAGWVIGTGNDTIVVGVAADAYAGWGGGVIASVIIDTAAATAFSISDASGVLATYPASLSIGTYELDIPWSGFLKIATTSTNAIRVVHSPGVPQIYAMA